MTQSDDHVHSKAELAVTFRDDKSPYLGLCEFVVFDHRQISIVVGHGIQPVQCIGRVRFSEED